MIENVIHHLALPLLERIGENYHFRCVVCGDSQKSQTKKRGWIFTDGKYPRYHCYNCGYTKPLFVFLKEHRPDVFKTYVKDKLKAKRERGEVLVQKVEKLQNPQSRLDVQKLIQLPPDHVARKYFDDRKLPQKFLRYFYWTDNFMEYTNTLIPGKFEKVPDEDPRIIIPHYSQNKKIFIIQGRSIDPDRLRYITVKLDETQKKVFGLERMNAYKTILIFEGAFDSIFMPNAIAISGADLDMNYLTELAPKERYIYCFDNEPRNPEMCQRVQKVLKAGFRVCLMPAKIKPLGKDINDLIRSGLSVREICVIIKENIVQGKMGLVKFKLWKKGK